MSPNRFTSPLIAFAALAVMVFTGCLANKHTVTRACAHHLGEGPVQLQGINRSGVACWFFIESYRAQTGRLVGRIRFENDDKEAKEIGMFATFYMHIRLETANGRPVYLAGPIPAPIKLCRSVPPQNRLDVPFDVILPAHFQMNTGMYKLSFIYDHRLEETQDGSGSPIIPWSRDKVCLRYDQAQAAP